VFVAFVVTTLWFGRVKHKVELDWVPQCTLMHTERIWLFLAYLLYFTDRTSHVTLEAESFGLSHGDVQDKD